MEGVTKNVIQFLNYIKALIKSWLRAGVGMAFLAATGYAVGELAGFGAGRSFHLSIVLFANGTISLILFLIFALIQPPKIRIHIRHSPVIFFCGFLHTFGQISTVYADIHIGPGNAAALYYTMPIFTAILSPFFLNFKIQRTHVVSIGLSTIGVFFITRSTYSGQKTSAANSDYWIAFGICVALIGAASHAGSLIIRRKLQDQTTESSVFVFSFLLQYSLISLIYCMVSGTWKTLCVSRIDLAMLVVCGLTPYSASLCMYMAVALENPATVSVILTSSVLMVNTGQKILFPSLNFGWVSIAGAILIFSSCAFIASVSYQDNSNEEKGSCKRDEQQAFLQE